MSKTIEEKAEEILKIVDEAGSRDNMCQQDWKEFLEELAEGVRCRLEAVLLELGEY